MSDAYQSLFDGVEVNQERLPLEEDLRELDGVTISDELDEFQELPGQLKLFEADPKWKVHWRGMPIFWQEDLLPKSTLKVHFRSSKDRIDFMRLVGQKFNPTTKFIWHPQSKAADLEAQRFVSAGQFSPRYPIYVISKGRWESRLTARALDEINVKYKIVIEPQEYPQYASVIDPAKILMLPFSNLGQGSIPARNWVWEHSLAAGFRRHWILDDNISFFCRLANNLKVKVKDGAIFRAAEDFTERYTNVPLSGFNYEFFAIRKSYMPPFIQNTRVYSCILLDNSLSHRWRGRYNEDTDLSLRVLKDGQCTLLFNAFLAKKIATMRMKGGNTEELYAGDGRLKMAESLKEQHPDVVEVLMKWGRPQHHVNYKIFKQRLELKPGLQVSDEPNEYGMALEEFLE